MGVKPILAALFLLMLAVPAWGQDLDKGKRAYNRGDFAAALRQFEPLADQGNSVAQFHLGGMYGTGRGVYQSYVEAANWFRKAANQGNAPAQTLLGLLYSHGMGVPANDVEAVKWLNLAAANGHTDATELRDEIAQAMAPAQIAEAQELAREWQKAFEKRKSRSGGWPNPPMLFQLLAGR